MISEVRQFHETEIEPILGKPLGATSSEVAALEKRLGIRLPVAYRQLLCWMGCDSGGALVGSNCFITDIEKNAKTVELLLEENGLSLALPKRYIAFFTHQGYQAAWFEIPTTEEDPPCFFFSESGAGTIERMGTVTEFFLRQLEFLLPDIKSVHGDRTHGSAKAVHKAVAADGVAAGTSGRVEKSTRRRPDRLT